MGARVTDVEYIKAMFEMIRVERTIQKKMLEKNKQQQQRHSIYFVEGLYYSAR